MSLSEDYVPEDYKYTWTSEHDLSIDEFAGKVGNLAERLSTSLT